MALCNSHRMSNSWPTIICSKREHVFARFGRGEVARDQLASVHDVVDGRFKCLKGARFTCSAWIVDCRLLCHRQMVAASTVLVERSGLDVDEAVFLVVPEAGLVMDVLPASQR